MTLPNSRSKRPLRLFMVVTIALAVVIPACSSSSGTNRDDTSRTASPSGVAGSGSGLWEQLAVARARKEKRVERRKALEARLDMSGQPFARGEREQMVDWFEKFVVDDPTWPELRGEWLDFGPGPSRILVEFLLITMVRSWDQRQQSVYRRSQGELIELSEFSEPYLVAAVERGFGDDVIRNHCIATLGLMGDSAIPGLQSAYDRAPRKQKYHVVRALSGMESPENVEFFGDVIDDEDDFQLRIAAIEGLGRTTDPQAVPILTRCLSDEDVSVRKFAAAYIGSFRKRSTVQPLIDCMARAEARRGPDNGEADVVANCRQSLRLMTKQRFRTAREWNAWWSRTRGG